GNGHGAAPTRNTAMARQSRAFASTRHPPAAPLAAGGRARWPGHSRCPSYRPRRMSRLEIHPLSELRGEAEALLTERYARQRAAEPLLPDLDDFEPHLPSEGHVATRGGDAVAYLAGTADGDMARWLFAGHAAREPEALRDLFALQADTFRVSRFML